MNVEPVDFVVPWVDGNDPAWIAERDRYLSNVDRTQDCRDNRYRDWGLFRYWFRAIATYAPWVRHIHILTWGHVPHWLNTTHPSIKIVKHADFIPAEYLPVFSSHPIELNMHRVPDLAEQFVYFNDDTFLGRPVTKDDYFKQGLPREAGIMNALTGGDIAGIVMNNIRLINSKFSKYQVLRKYFWKWYNPGYGPMLARNLLLLPWREFTGFLDTHQATPFLKSSVQEVWETWPTAMHASSGSKFRALSDCNQYLFRYWQLASGHFAPKLRKSAMFQCTGTDLEAIRLAFTQKKYHGICLNDMSQTTRDLETYKTKLQSILEQLFPEKSPFEI